MPKRWAQPRSTVSLLEKPTLRRLQQKRMNIAAQLKEIPAIAADRTNIPWDIMRSLGMVSRHIKNGKGETEVFFPLFALLPYITIVSFVHKLTTLCL